MSNKNNFDPNTVENNDQITAETPEVEEEDPTITGDEGGCGQASWIVPSVLFGVAIIIAIVGFAIKKIATRPRKKKPVKGTVSYDRRNTIVLPNKKPTTTEETAEDTTVIDVEETAEDTTEETVAPEEEAQPEENVEE